MVDTEESPSQRQARIRREKREKKILAGGSARLDKITSLSGRPASETETSTTDAGNTTTPSFRPVPTSQAQSQASATGNEPTPEALEASMRQLLRGNDASSFPPTAPQLSRNTSNRAQEPDEPQDPMLALLQQMMGANMPPTADGMPAQPGGGFDGLPPGLAAMLGGGLGGGMGASEAEAQEAVRNVYRWKILHALFALALGVYILYTYTFSGTLYSRDRVVGFSDTLPVEGRLFWIFITAQLGLQGGRYLLEGGRSEEGMIKTVSGFLPPPWGERVRLVGRYAGIWSTLVQDAFVVVFLLGVAAWWKGDGVEL